ncbi:DUF4388 domain-containing protein [Dictyobacter aurantiacus]|uniref:DUF4388 domain-containing protein n=1 Tax=Dictyobacter aurantiacus TaxID=1936993 RepID=A0A401ZE10_9CHLR|nr:DUF4388 domain-containing protein [Dictyobacter aurantiacus]GCE05117.1 hypothetical protein KDAU_24460 [Dictyobacter aurantiacus]
MSDQFGTITDRLADVIRVITFSRQTGTLFAEHNGPQGPEKAVVRFLRGKMIETQATPPYQGKDVQAWLEGWGSCRFRFDHSLEQPKEQESKPAPTAKAAPRSATHAEKPATSIPSPVTPPPGIPIRNTDPMRRINHPITNPGFPLWGGVSQQQTDPYQIPVSSTSMQRVPQRRSNNNEQNLRQLEQHRLSRVHRQVFLLVDNRRTPQELGRLTSRRLDEIYVLLSDLERAGLITL